MTEGNSKLVVTHVISGDLWAGAEVKFTTFAKRSKRQVQVTPTVVIFNEGILLKSSRSWEYHFC